MASAVAFSQMKWVCSKVTIFLAQNSPRQHFLAGLQWRGDSDTKKEICTKNCNFGRYPPMSLTLPAKVPHLSLLNFSLFLHKTRTADF